MDRRKFLRNATVSATGTTILPGISVLAKTVKRSASGLFLGTPALPEYLFGRGIANELDRMQELAGIQSVMTFSHSHVFRQYQPGFGHKTDADGKPLTDLFVKTDPKYYSHPALQGITTGKYAGRDILDELYEETEKRGMKVFARILEPYRITGVIPGFEEFAEENSNNEKGPNVCFNHPEYIAYWDSVIEDLIHNHSYLHGFKFGQERAGPMHEALAGRAGTCFCKHCRKIADSLHINMEQARRGVQALQQYSIGIKNEERPADGNFVTFIRILSEYPDLLSLEKLWMDSREGQRKRMYKKIKSINPVVQVGWHIDHGMTWDILTRAFNNYATMGPYSDWLSTAVYFDSMGRRSRNHYNKNHRNLLLGDATPDISYPMYLSMLGYDPKAEATLEEHEEKDTSFSAEYVYAECRRAVMTVKGTAKVYARPGWDMPGYDCDVQPEEVHAAVTRALDAGVDGLWCGREWDELQEKNIIAFGKAVRDYKY